MAVQSLILHPWQFLATAVTFGMLGYTFVVTQLSVTNTPTDVHVTPLVQRQRSHPRALHLLTTREEMLPLSQPSKTPSTLPPTLCPPITELKLQGRLNMGTMSMENQVTMDNVNEVYHDVQHGHWAPNCIAQHKVAIIIPFRDRLSHLTLWLAHVLPILQRQQLDFHIVVAEQVGSGRFNKGRLFNAAFTYAERLNVSCIVLQDVDLFPEDDRLSYGCPLPGQPNHMGAWVDTLNYKLMYHKLVGGVLSMDVADYWRINGFSNEYWGWGGEDDDMGIRLLESNLTIARPNKLIGRYTMLKHESRKPTEANKERHELLKKTKDTMHVDGLRQNIAVISNVTIQQLYHHLWIDVQEPTTTTVEQATTTAVEKTEATTERLYQGKSMLRLPA